jgi:hypothetical protein
MISDLECAAALAFAFLSAPIDTPTLTIPTPPLARSLGGNMIGDQGASTLAAILKETKITSLGCAATRVFAFLSAPLDTRMLALYLTLTFTAWTPTSSVASTMMVTASTSLRASPSCARGSRGAP